MDRMESAEGIFGERLRSVVIVINRRANTRGLACSRNFSYTIVMTKGLTFTRVPCRVPDLRCLLLLKIERDTEKIFHRMTGRRETLAASDAVVRALYRAVLQRVPSPCSRGIIAFKAPKNNALVVYGHHHRRHSAVNDWSHPVVVHRH